VLLVGSILAIATGVAAYLIDRPAGTARQPAALRARNRRRMLERVSHHVADLLWQPPGEPTPIRLGLDARPDLVATPRELLAQRLAQSPRIDAVFGAAEEALVILGGPGAGKTRLLAELASSLLARARQHADEPIPVVVHLASWATRRRALADWLADELHDRYDMPTELGHAWIAAGQVLPLLDGLDEIPQSDQAGCVAAINAFRAGHGLVGLAVCCRLADYQRLGGRLRLRGAVELQPPTRRQLDDYLNQAGADLPVVRAALEHDESLWELLQSPLTLSVMTRASREAPNAVVPASGTPEQRREQLFEVYVDAMLTRRRTEHHPGQPRAPYQRDQVIGWLGWLACSMREHRQVRFRLDHLQPSWLPASSRRWVAKGNRVAVGLAAGLVLGLFFGLVGALRGAIWAVLAGGAAGLILGLFGALAYTPSNEAISWSSNDPPFADEAAALTPQQIIRPVEMLSWSWSAMWARRSRVRTVVRKALRHAVYAGAGIALGSAVTFVPRSGLLVGIGTALLFGLFAVLFYALLFSGGATLVAAAEAALVAELRPVSGSPNEAIRRSAVNAVRVGLLASLPIGLLSGLVYGLILRTIWDGVGIGLTIGLVGGVLFALNAGGYACLQHLVVRVLLVRAACAPWRYARFLEYATDRVLLRRVGGAYEFIHPLLLDHLAAARSDDAESMSRAQP